MRILASGCCTTATLICAVLVCSGAANAQSSGLPSVPSPHLATATSAALEHSASSPPVLTLAEAVDLASNANPQYRAAKLQAAASLEQYKALRTQYFPTLYTAGIYSELLKKLQINIPAGQFGNFPATGPVPATDTTLNTPRKPFSLVAGFAAQPLTGLIGTHFSVGSQHFMAESKTLKAEQIRQQQITMVTKVYVQVGDAEAQTTSSAASVAAAQESSRIIHIRYAQSTALQSQVDIADAQLASLESQQQQDLDQLIDDKEKLNQLIGRDVMMDFITEPNVETASVDDLSDATLRQMALQNRPDLKSDDALIAAGELQIKATRAKYIPDISASFIYIGLPSSVRGLPESFTAAGAQITWSPWDWGEKLHEIRAQRAGVAQAHVQRDQDRDQIIADVNQAARLIRQRRMQIRSAALNAKAKRSKLTETQTQARNSTVLLDDLLRAQSDDVNAQTQLKAARNNFLEAKAQLQQAIGEVQ